MTIHPIFWPPIVWEVVLVNITFPTLPESTCMWGVAFSDVGMLRVCTKLSLWLYWDPMEWGGRAWGTKVTATAIHRSNQTLQILCLLEEVKRGAAISGPLSPKKSQMLGKDLALCHSFHEAASSMGLKEGQPPVMNNKGADILGGALEGSGWVLRAILP